LQRKVAVKDDNALLKGLPKVKTQATWVPWTFGRLCFASGYGAGLESPGWYQHLWDLRASDTDRSRQVATAWLVRTAKLLRGAGFDASSANIIEAVRLSESLAAMRDKPLPGLPELEESTVALLTFGAEQPLSLIRQQLIVGERLGAVPDEVPQLPLQQDLAALQKRLRLAPKADQDSITLDLRKDIGLARSQLLHRLNLIDIPWGTPESVSGRGTFKEAWRLQWQPEFAIKLIEASVWGVTVETAATARACHEAAQSHSVAELAGLLDALLLANLEQAIHRTVARLNDVAAVSSDLMDLMQALLPLARVARYGNVRGADASTVEHVLEGMLVRITIGLYGACGALDDTAAETMVRAVDQCQSAISLLQNPAFERDWYAALSELSDSNSLAASVAGRATRILLGANVLDIEQAAARFQLALSMGNELSYSSAWLEGFLSGSGMLLVHEETLWQIVDDWLCRLQPDDFIALLPLIRRTFSTFSSGEIVQLAQRVQQGTLRTGATDTIIELDTELAERSLPLIALILGLKSA